MQEFPHHYRVHAASGADGVVAVDSAGLERLNSAAPAEFGGPGTLWSPETLLVAAVGNCFILTFRAIARASKVQWTSLACDIEGILDRVERVTRFTGFRLSAKLEVPGPADEARLMRMLEKAESTCLITNSLAATVHLDAEIRVSGQGR